MSTTTTSARRSGTSRKVRALLAGGVVLGIGAAATLAAWNDSEYAGATFTAGSFNLEGAVDGADGSYTDHASATDGVAPLEFSLPVGNLAPGDAVAAPFWVRLDADTTTAATLDLVSLDSTDTTGGNSSHLGYAVYAIDADATCSVTTTGTLLGEGATLADDPAIAGDTVALPVGAEGVAGEPTQLCFVVTAGDDLEQGGSTEAVWQLTATSS